MAISGRQKKESPFHRGERAIHEKLGYAEQMDTMGRRMIRDFLTEQHQTFFAQLPYVLVGTIDTDGNSWASILVGKPGFISTINDGSEGSTSEHRTLHIEAQPPLGDPLAKNIAEGIDIGFLGIELHTRRRNRVNGVVSAISHNGFDVQVTQTFGNCPKYIQARQLNLETFNLTDPKSSRMLTTLGEIEYAMIAAADTFFISTAYFDDADEISKGVDVSHRGGKPGFVHINDNTLTVPDYSGNNIFNTFGNIEMNPRAGLLFIDFETGDLLYLTGQAEIIWDGSPEIASYEGAERLLKYHVEKGVWVKGGIPTNWSAPEYSPFLEQLSS